MSVILTLMLMLMTATVATPSVAVDETSPVKIGLPETVELALVIAALKEQDEEASSLNRETEYYQGVIENFAPYRDHPAVVELPEEFNLPRLAGNAADFDLGDDNSIVEIDRSGSLWGDRENDLFRNHIENIQDFAQVSEFAQFYAEHEATYQAAFASASQFMAIEDMIRWLDDNFSGGVGSLRLIISPLIGSHNWTTLDKPETRMWLPAPDTEGSGVLSEFDRIRYGASVFTELDHSYVNPVTAGFREAIEAAFANKSVWANEQAIENYSSGELQFNEYMTWAVFLMYAHDRLSPDDFQNISEAVTGLMEERRGFIAFGEFSDHAVARYAAGNTAASVTEEMVDWAGRYAVRR